MKQKLNATFLIRLATIAFSILNPSTSFAQSNPPRAISGSSLNLEQIRRLQTEVTKPDFRDETDERKVLRLNNVLRSLALGADQLLPTDGSVSFAESFDGRDYVGVFASTPRNLICLPCETANGIGWGSIAAGEEPRLSGGTAPTSPSTIGRYAPSPSSATVNYFESNKTEWRKLVGHCQYIPRQTNVFTTRAASCGGDPVYICRARVSCQTAPPASPPATPGRTGPFGRQRANPTETFEENVACHVPDGVCPQDPVDCMAGESLLAVRSGEDAIATHPTDTKATVRSAPARSAQ